MRYLAALLALSAILVALTAPEPSNRGTLDDLRTDAVYVLRQCPGVASVTRMVGAREPKHRVIHVVDMHAVAPDELAADLRDQDPAITDADVEAEYRAIVAVAARVQTSQRQLIRWLARYHGVRRVHLEGLTDADMPAFMAIVEAARNNPEALPPSFGAVGQSLVAGELAEVVPAEDEEAYREADPFAEGSVTFEGAANDARETAILRRLLDAGPLAVIVLGAAHDLSQHVRAAGDVEYLRVSVEGVPQ